MEKTDSLSKALEFFKKYDQYIDSISYNGSTEDFTIEISLTPNECDEFYSAYLDVYSDGSVSVHELKATCFGEPTDVIDINFLNVLSDMGRLWYNTIDGGFKKFDESR